MTKEETALTALEWFKVYNIAAFAEDGSVYVEIDGFEFELCDFEVKYRADEYLELKDRNLIKNLL